MDWKQHHANEADKAWAHPLVEDIINEQMGNIVRCGPWEKDSALLRHSLVKVAMYAAQVARAQALGFDPSLLSMTVNEGNAEMLNLVKRAALTGMPMAIVVPSQKDRKATDV